MWLKPSFWSVRSFIRTDIVTMISHDWSGHDETYREYSLASTDDLIGFWRSKVKVTIGHRGRKGAHINAGAFEVHLLLLHLDVMSVDWVGQKVKYLVRCLYSAFLRPKQSQSATEWQVLTGSHSFYLPRTRPSVGIHQMAPPKRGGTRLI